MRTRIAGVGRARRATSQGPEATMEFHTLTMCEWYEGAYGHGYCSFSGPCVFKDDQFNCGSNGCSTCSGMDHPVIEEGDVLCSESLRELNPPTANGSAISSLRAMWVGRFVSRAHSSRSARKQEGFGF